MKKSFYALLLALAAHTSVYADYNQIEYSDVQISEGQTEGSRGPWTIDFNYDYIGKSKFDKRGYKHQKIQFSSLDIDGSMVFYHEPKYKEAANFEVGYDRTIIDWKENPYFTQTEFETVNISFGAITQRLCNWLWKAKLTMNIDAKHKDLGLYSTYDALGWGRYTYSDDIGVHIGILVLTGMKIDHVYPILGCDWKINEQWKLNAVFPVNMSVVYAYDDNWSFDTAIRAFQVRYRVGEHQPLTKAVTLYQAVGVEFGVNYDIEDQLRFNFHVGSTLGGKLKIANRSNNRPHHFRFDPAPYAGVDLEYYF